MDHVGASTRYRLESGGAQTPWYAATVVRQVRLTSLSAGVNPPAYTGVKPATVVVKPDAPDADPVTVPQGVGRAGVGRVRRAGQRRAAAGG